MSSSSRQLRVEKEWQGVEPYLRLSGALDLEGSLVLRQAADDILPYISTEMVVDCAALRAVDSAGIGALVGLYRVLREHNLSLRLSQVPAKIAELLRITKLDRVLSHGDGPPPATAGAGLATTLMPEGQLLHCWEVMQCQETDCELHGGSGYMCWIIHNFAGCDAMRDLEGGTDCLSCRVFRTNVNYLGEAQENFERYIQEAEGAFAKLRAERDTLGRELGKVRALLAAALEQSADYVFAADGRGRLVLWNPALVALTGRSISELKDVYAAVRALSPPDVPQARRFLDFIDGRNSEPLFEAKVLSTSTGERDVSWSRQLVLDPAGMAMGLLAVGRDVTQYRQAEQALREQEERQRYVMENITEGLALVIDGSIAYANPALAAVSGYSPEQLKAMAFAELFDPSRQDTVRRFVERNSSGEVLRYQSVLLNAARQPVHIEVTQGSASFRERPAQIVMLRDVSARRRLLAYERLIPICSSCGAIRDDSLPGSGNGGWFRLEEFLQQTVERSLTHTICPDCVEQLRREALDLVPGGEP